MHTLNCSQGNDTLKFVPIAMYTLAHKVMHIFVPEGKVYIIPKSVILNVTFTLFPR